MRSLVFNSFIVALFFFSQKSHALYLIEPYLGYGLLTSVDQESGIRNNSADLNTSSQTDADGNYMLYGGRLGLAFPFVFAAFDYYVGDGKISYNNSTSADDDFTQTDMSILAGIKIPVVGFRFFGGLTFKTELEITDGDTGTTGTYEGKGIRLGIGWELIPFIAVNLEYFSHSYDTYTNSSGRVISLPSATSLSSSSGGGEFYTSEYEISGIFLNISVPIDI